MQKVMIVGAGKGGTALLRILRESREFQIVCLADINPAAPGMLLAEQMGIPREETWKNPYTDTVDIIIDTTGDRAAFEEIRSQKHHKALLIPGSVAYIIARLFEEKNQLIHNLKAESRKRELIFNATSDGMIVINKEGYVILFNRSAEKMTATDRSQVIGKHISDLVPCSGLLDVIKTRRTEANQQVSLKDNLKLITTRIPLLDEEGEVIGAFSVFKDITEAVRLAEEITDLKEIDMMLNAIIQSSDEAISVVDDMGRGMMINPAYTRITGLTEEQVIGKPATIDIYEGESMHMKVLKTKKPVRGVNMRVGPKRKEVIVNVAPVIVDGQLKGSVGVIHDVSEIRQLTNELDRARQIIRTLQAKYSFDDIIGTSEEMTLAVEQAKLSARTPATVLLRGESGTGKELFAHAIHNASDRKFNRFIRVNCAAISESLLESELFGYEDGAFTGAKRGGKAGYFEEADNGSIFLDEIGELTPKIQAKLLRVLQENEVVRVGGTKPIRINVRVIAATNINLENAIKNGDFREDLYFRLNRMPIFISPLRKRIEDIKELSCRLIMKINEEYGRNVEGITDRAIDKLCHYHWPGNVRELENILGRAIIFMKLNETQLDVHHLPDFLEPFVLGEKNGTGQQTKDSYQSGKPLAEMLEIHEAQLLKEALQNHQHNKTATAKSLGISIRSLYYKMEKYKL
ncbi:sigma 54-interacting transcriptional regulator [Bacillus massiliglaciei]|uniref:sigma 54-interacting transcriptional regulator n=1 Tax=Bacillus massiliglaciei TaxID=1816693 RepID=UPI000ACE23F8|nr:sigma 54-interacting transcriptional regulator [Bacillus massiliglaciei]